MAVGLLEKISDMIVIIVSQSPGSSLHCTPVVTRGPSQEGGGGGDDVTSERCRRGRRRRRSGDGGGDDGGEGDDSPPAKRAGNTKDTGG